MTSLKDELDEPSQQLHQTLRDSITASLSTRRPLLTHLNADTTWLLSLPVPPSHPSKKHRLYFYILIDPWLTGPQSDVAAFFSTQWHAIPSSCQTIKEVEEVIQGIEDVAAGSEKQNGEEGWIDAVVISHEFTDHMHQSTLLSLPPSVPVFATAKAYSIIKSWKHFHTVLPISRFSGDWTKERPGGGILPDWIGVHRVAYAGNDLLYYHSAILISFISGEGKDVEGVIYTPHGISPSDLTPLTTSSPTIKVLALLHGLQDISLQSWLKAAQLNMGAHNGLKVVRMLKVKYWVGTHDEVKKGGGVVGWLLKRIWVSLEEALKMEGVGKGGEEVKFVEVGNGESLVLE
ncbi:hypothetical protein NA56DRAFT_635284 [Hyaloscypha hepaticicola]|uniref:Metallo-beta-lactamase domain-containing protein n=1 Tax=Hyaloscypha hepaticicola TaxID=2082293 RepID=A0A2J6PLM4_9HELO|nr:hypothetical protein NA56DRAFT_635284 [Hyaloscypha hepaticicola]